ncbi:unnamed protein product, partial [Tuber aestivum]
MTHHRTPSNHSSGPQSLPHSQGAGESWIKSSKKWPLKPFSSDRQSRRNIAVVLRGFLVTFLALVLLAICLWAFSQGRQLSKWEQRSFNTLSILLTAIASLGLGSLLGHLGSMLRWPLLARTVYQMQDVDSILGMSPPAGSMRLIRRHIREWRVSRTTFIVTAYLIGNIFGRLSVVVFGLTYNMTDETGIQYPILATNWTSALWTGKIFPDDGSIRVDQLDSGQAFMNSLLNGLQKYAELPKWINKIANSSSKHDISLYLESDLQLPNITLKVDANTVEYSYKLKDFKGDYTRPSNRTVHSSVNCSLMETLGYQYWRWNNGNRTGPFYWSEESSSEVVSEILRISDIVSSTTPKWVSLQDYLGGSGVYPQIYIVFRSAVWECWPTLTETIGGHGPQQVQPDERIFHPTELYRLLTLGEGEHIYATKDKNGGHYVYLNTFSIIDNKGRADGGVPYLYNNLGDGGSESEVVRNSYNLWVAGLVARLPILAIMHGNDDFPRFALGPHPNQTSGTAYLHTTLEVNWVRVILIVASITGGQVLAILAVLSYCKGVYTRDDSHLATAELLKTVINRFDDGKLMTGEELARSLDDVLGVPVSYGTRKGPDGGPPEVDLASGLEAKFPPSPQKEQF